MRKHFNNSRREWQGTRRYIRYIITVQHAGYGVLSALILDNGSLPPGVNSQHSDRQGTPARWVGGWSGLERTPSQMGQGKFVLPCEWSLNLSYPDGPKVAGCSAVLGSSKAGSADSHLLCQCTGRKPDKYSVMVTVFVLTSYLMVQGSKDPGSGAWRWQRRASESWVSAKPLQMLLAAIHFTLSLLRARVQAAVFGCSNPSAVPQQMLLAARHFTLPLLCCRAARVQAAVLGSSKAGSADSHLLCH